MGLLLQAAPYAGLLTRRDQPRAHAGIFRAVGKIAFGAELDSQRATRRAVGDMDDAGADVAQELLLQGVDVRLTSPNSALNALTGSSASWQIREIDRSSYAVSAAIHAPVASSLLRVSAAPTAPRVCRICAGVIVVRASGFLPRFRPIT